MRTKKTGWSQLWKRNAVVAAIALFVCAAVYLNWNYGKETDAGKTLGQSAMVGGRTQDPLLGGDSSAAGGAGEENPGTAGDTGTAGDAGNVQSSGEQQRLSLRQLLRHRPPQPAAGPGQRPVPAPGRRRPGGRRRDGEKSA